MRTRGNHGTGRWAGRQAGTVALAGLTLLALGVGSPAQAADQAADQRALGAGSGKGTGKGGGTTSKQKPAPKPEPVEDTTAPQRPALGEASTEPGGTVRLDVQAESGSALVVREGTEVVASASAFGGSQTLTWESESGPHTFLVVATDAAGNVSDPAPLTLEIDATPPAARKLVVKPGTERSPLTRWGVLTDPGTAYTVLVDGTTVEEGTAEGRTVRGQLELADGSHDVEVQLRDEVGNVSTITETVAVDIPALWVAAKDVSEPNATERTFKVAAAPGTRGYLRVPGAGHTRFQLPDGRAQVTLEVEEGSYEAPVVIVADSLDRKGSTELEAFEVDLTAPALSVETVAGGAERGVVSATITAGEGDTVAWRLLTDSGVAVMSGEFVADGSAQLFERQVAKGSYELEVTATDANGNATVELLGSSVSASPMINPDVVPALTVALALWIAVGLVVFLRRRGRRLGKVAARGVRGLRTKRAQLMAEHQQAVAEHDEALAAFEREDRVWQQRRAELAQLVAVARGAELEYPVTDVTVHPGERVLCVRPASLVELQDQDGVEVPVEVEDGRLVVTESRVAFAGSENREWTFAGLEKVRHLGQDRTLMKVADRETVSGVAYADADADVVRLYLELAMAEASGDSRSVRMMLEQGVRSHELRRPQPPTPVGPAPVSGRKAHRNGAGTTESTESTTAEPVVHVARVVEDAERATSTAQPAAATAAPVAQLPTVIGRQGVPADEPIGRELTLQR